MSQPKQSHPPVDAALDQDTNLHAPQPEPRSKRRVAFKKMIRPDKGRFARSYASSGSDAEGAKKRPEKWNMGIMNDKVTDEVPGGYYPTCA